MASNEGDEEEHPFMKRLRQRVVQDPSPRDPMISRDNNPADQIEAQMQFASNHRTWGFVIYRSSYVDDADWQECLRRIRTWTEDGLNDFNGRDIFDLLTWTIFDDQTQFDGASTAVIRQHFKQWSALAVRTEQDGSDGNDNTNRGWSPRYHYCIQIDKEAMDSVLQCLEPPEIDRVHQGWIKLIQRDWLPARENTIHARLAQIDDTVYEPVEGVIVEHIGWVKCPVRTIMVSRYVQFQDRNGYGRVEERPPAIIT